MENQTVLVLGRIVDRESPARTGQVGHIVLWSLNGLKSCFTSGVETSGRKKRRGFQICELDLVFLQLWELQDTWAGGWSLN